jgi:hypothetical protein
VGDRVVVISGDTLTLTPTTALVAGRNYHIAIDNTALLDAAGVAAPAHWGNALTGACECGTCSALLRLNLQAQGLAGLEVQVSVLAGAFGDVQSLHERFAALAVAGACGHSGCAAGPGSSSAAAAAPAAAVAEAALSCPPCEPSSEAAEQQQQQQQEEEEEGVCECEACPACPSAAAASSDSSASSSSSSSGCGRSGTGAAPVWLASLDMRAVPPPPCSILHAFQGVPQEACQHRQVSIPTRCVVGRHEDHWQFFVKLVSETAEPFALMRYVDGERMILQGTPVGTSTQAFSEDKWSWSGGESRLATDMAAGLRGHYGEPVFYAFATPQDDEHGLRWYTERTEAACGQITLANLWINR